MLPRLWGQLFPTAQAQQFAPAPSERGRDEQIWEPMQRPRADLRVGDGRMPSGGVPLSWVGAAPLPVAERGHLVLWGLGEGTAPGRRPLAESVWKQPLLVAVPLKSCRGRPGGSSSRGHPSPPSRSRPHAGHRRAHRGLHRSSLFCMKQC